MKRLVLFTAIAAVTLGGANVAAAAEIPTYESMGLPITPVQISVVGSAHVQEVSPFPTLTVGSIPPPSPHQIAVLTARKNIVGELAEKPTTGSGAVTR
jgi:hypothetical protein